MIYKRAGRMLLEAGIRWIAIKKLACGIVPQDVRAERQNSRCFETWQEAAQAVIDGYRPSVTKWKGFPVLVAEREGDGFRIMLSGSKKAAFRVRTPGTWGWETLQLTVPESGRVPAQLSYDDARMVCEFLTGRVYPDQFTGEVDDEEEAEAEPVRGANAGDRGEVGGASAEAAASAPEAGGEVCGPGTMSPEDAGGDAAQRETGAAEA